MTPLFPCFCIIFLFFFFFLAPFFRLSPFPSCDGLSLSPRAWPTPRCALLGTSPCVLCPHRASPPTPSALLPGRTRNLTFVLGRNPASLSHPLPRSEIREAVCGSVLARLMAFSVSFGRCGTRIGRPVSTSVRPAIRITSVIPRSRWRSGFPALPTFI